MNRLFYATIFILSTCLTLTGIGCSKQASPRSEPANNSSEAAPRADIKLANTNEQPSTNISYTVVQWTDLLPDEDLEALENPPEYLNEIEDGSESDQLAGQLKAESPSGPNTPGSNNDAEKRYQQALASKKIRPEYNGRHIRIPGFIVPLEFNDQQTITTFFIVPFFGACLHMPPPPPNQIIYGEYEPGMKLAALYDPFWVNGTLSTTLIENDMATAAYSINAVSIEPYDEYVSPPGNAETP